VPSGFDLTGLVANDDYTLRMEARKDGSIGGLTARGAYFTSITVTPIPGAIWLQPVFYGRLNLSTVYLQ